MKTNQAIAIVIGVVVIVALIAIFTRHPKNQEVGIDGTTVSPTAAQTSASQPGRGTPSKTSPSSTATSSPKKPPFDEFMKNSGSLFCRINSYNYSTNNYGTVYIDGGKIRGNFTFDYQGNKVNTSVIVRDGYVYAWAGRYPTGYRVPAASAGKATTLDGRTFTWDTKLIGDYQCQDWTDVQSSVFVVPTNIEFQTIQ